MKERTTNAAYILSDQEYPLEFAYAGQETALVSIAVNGGEAIANELLRGRVDGKKYGESPDSGDPVELAGALIGLFAPDTEAFTEEQALLTVTTGEDGSFAFEEISYGHWIIGGNFQHLPFIPSAKSSTMFISVRTDSRLKFV